MKVCKACRAEVASDLSQCPYDGSALDSAAPDPLLGTVLANNYEILSVLGRGGMSTVYKALHILMNRTVAIKLLQEQLQDPLVLGRFQREAQTLSKLKHPNIVTVFDFGTTASGEAFLVMDLVEGTGLDAILVSEGHLTPRRAVPIFIQIGAALAHAHQNNIIHRDLKPGNVCIAKEKDGSDSVRIVDFGLAKFVATDAKSARNLTRPGQVCGSPLYMSPEQVQGKQLDGRSDIYSLGCLMYETMSGVPPFWGEDTFSTMSKHVGSQAAKFNPGLNVPTALEAIIMRALAKDPKDRFQSAEDLEDALSSFAQSSFSTTTIVPRQPPRSRKRVVVPLVILLVIALVLLLLKGTH